MTGNDQKSGSVSRRELSFLDPVEIPGFDAEGASSGTKTFTAGGVRNFPNIALLKEAVRHYQGRLRQGNASTKERGEVKGSPRKPWRQKGTGRARSGSRKSPIWRGGGVVFGPKPRSYDYGLPRKQRRLATRHALLSKLVDGETRVVALGRFDKPATADLSKVLGTMGVNESCLIGIASDTDKAEVRNIVQSCRNLHNTKVLVVAEFNALDLLKHRSLVLTDGALEEIQGLEDALRSGQESDA